MNNKIDKENMFKSIWEFADNLEDAYSLGNNIQLKHKYTDIKNIIISGMGGSAIGGDVASVLERKNFKTPLEVLRGYKCPSYVNKNTLVICSSYSGNTEETISVFMDALKKGAMICGITTGGTLKEELVKKGKDIITIPKGLQPRAALAYSFIPIIKFMDEAEIIDSSIDNWLEGTINILRNYRLIYSKKNEKNPIYNIADKIKNKLPIIYADSSSLAISAVRLRGQLAENSKMLAYHNDLPELNHNEIVGWENNLELISNFVVLWLKDISDNPRVKNRQIITNKILKEINIEQYNISVDGDSFEQRFLHMIHFGDWLSYWCALLLETDPSPVHKINRLKDELSKINDPS
tara:strand:+ start:3150 stop:4199 length:1050 start_codon:yes stop_codon:yes gene_type:complete